MFTDYNLQTITDLVKDQFPDFYKKEGENFIVFIQAYYEWLAQEGNPIYNARNRYKTYDIDTAPDDFLSHYREKYMWGLPPEILGNQRLLQKHILELYRAKGSQAGIQLLFRLLYNETVDFYVPSYDIFKLSDNTWIQPHYIEVTSSPYFSEMINYSITGSESGASAIVETYEQRVVNDNIVDILFISNIKGEFHVGETLLCRGFAPISLPKVLGSVVGVDITGSSPGLAVGDVLIQQNSEKPVKIVVTETYDGTGGLTFNVLDGGTYYTMNTVFYIDKVKHEDNILPYANTDIDSITYGFPKDPDSNVDTIIGDSIYSTSGGDEIVPDDIAITGDGADLRVLSLKNTFLYQYNNDKILGYLSTELDGTYPFPALPTSNLATIVADSLSYVTLTVGTIDKLLVLNPGVNYSANVNVIAIDPYTSTSGIKDANGNFVGMNAKIVGNTIIGDQLAKSVTVVSSGYNNYNMTDLVFTGQANVSLNLAGLPIIGGAGWSEGYYDNTKSFLSDDKYLFDGHYYQDYSYVIKASKTLDKYIDILRLLAHPSGNAVYGDVKISANNRLVNDAEIVRLRKEPI